MEKAGAFAFAPRGLVLICLDSFVRGCAAQVSPLGLVQAAEEYQRWFRGHVETVNKNQGELAGRIVQTEAAARDMGSQLQGLSKGAGAASARLSTDVEAVTKQVIEMQKRMEELIASAEGLRRQLPPANAARLPTFAEYMQRMEAHDKEQPDLSSAQTAPPPIHQA